MLRWSSVVTSGLVWALTAASASAQPRDVVYDTLTEGTPAAITCGFCEGEKFGMVFRQLSSPSRPGLRTDEFPLTVNAVMLAVARTNVSGTTCTGTTAGGPVSMMIEAFAGPTPPTGSILDNPPSGPWPGETMLFGESAELQLSAETSAGTAMYDIMVNTVTIPMGVNVPAPNRYVRVVASIPSGAGTTSSDSCDLLSLNPPAAVPLRDGDGPVESEVAFIYAKNPLSDLGLGYPQGWHWNETSDPARGVEPIQGDWLIRLDVTPMPSGAPDAGMPPLDAGMDDAGTGDAGHGATDAGGSDAGTIDECAADTDCAGGERCVEGVCQRVSCVAATDCAGGMTCVNGMCRSLCAADAECRGGEVCDTEAGHCAPVSMESGGCGCRTVGAGSRSSAALVLLGLALVVVGRRRRR